MSANPYDPVTTTDTTTLSDDDWGLSLPGVRYKNYYGQRSRCEAFCQKIQERPKATALVCLFLAIAILFVVIVIMAASGGGDTKMPEKFAKWNNQTEGLEFYPIPYDKSVLISFNVKGHNDTFKLMLDKATEPYQSLSQLKDSYVDCTEKDSPANKTCRFFNHKFGKDCQSAKDYGYKSGMPCILVQLNLPDDVIIRPINSSSSLWPVARPYIKDSNDTSTVPFRCQGLEVIDDENKSCLGALVFLLGWMKSLLENNDFKTKKDRDLIGTKGLETLDAIEYHPPGFPSYFYRKRDLNLPFIKPAIMIRLTSLLDDHLVHISCKAFGQLFKLDHSVEDHDILSMEFAVLVKHG